jgi:formylglycine-generating enzyme required for sulfatase activity
MKNQTEGDLPLTPAGFTPEPVIEPLRFEPYQPTTGRKLFRARPRTLIISAALLLCALLAGYIVTGKAVYLSTDPADAQIEISGGWQLKLADRYLLRAGDYRLLATAPGYHPLDQLLTVTGEQNQQYAYTLRPLPGHLKIETVPAISAEIRVDNTVHGQTPATLTPLEPGTYTLQLLADRYLPYETEVTISGKDQEQSLTAELKPAWGDVRLETLPAGADVYVDDQLAGQTPLTAEILQGEHNLRIKLAGYKDWRKAVRVTAGEAQQLSNIALEQADAVVQIITRPAGASVTVDGEYKGTSPLEVALTPGKAATIRLFSQGYAQSVQTINAKSGDSRTLNIELQQEIAEVRILAEPADAEVYIDGKPQGLADQTVALSTTPHTIEIRKAGYLDYKTTITPRPGIAQQVSARLKSVEQAKRDAIRVEISSPAGQKLKLFEAAAITMGASRREPGRRANETIRNVQFTRPFYLSLTEVTNAEYRQFDSAHNSGEVQGHDLNGDKQPVVNISWEQAALYCNWLSEKAGLTPFYQVTDNKVTGFNPAANGYRLPTEAEWEWAARDQGNNLNLKFAWGDALPPAPKSGNYADVSAASILAIVQAEYTDGFTVTAPVASFTPNQKGLYDIGGNVAEWTHDFYDINMVEEGSTALDPLGAASGEHHVIRGSSWGHGSVTELRLSFRDYGKDKRNDVGFRIARYLE